MSANPRRKHRNWGRGRKKKSRKRLSRRQNDEEMKLKTVFIKFSLWTFLLETRAVVVVLGSAAFRLCKHQEKL